MCLTTYEAASPRARACLRWATRDVWIVDGACRRHVASIWLAFGETCPAAVAEVDRAREPPALRWSAVLAHPKQETLLLDFRTGACSQAGCEWFEH
jgi:hypothetical protein